MMKAIVLPSEEIQKKEYSIYQQKIAKVQSVLQVALRKDTKFSPIVLHGRRKAKLKELKTQMVKENKILESRLFKIQCTTSKSTSVKNNTSVKSNSVANKNSQERNRIEADNLKLLKRLQTSKPHYSNTTLKQHYQQHQHFVSKLSAFSPGNTNKKNNRNRYSSKARRIVQKQEKFNPFKTGIKLQGQYYLVQINSTQDKLDITLYNLVENTKISSQLEVKELSVQPTLQYLSKIVSRISITEQSTLKLV